MSESLTGTPQRPVVIKIGGSVLTGKRAFAKAARWLLQTHGASGPLGLSAPLIVVVSAEQGLTDRLWREALAITPSPDARARDLLWSTGELRSAAMLALHLQAQGVAARALSVHETGIRAGARGLRVRTRCITRALEAHAVVVVPGFLGVSEAGEVVSLGRGGSDLSAVALASAVSARACELVKDVPGYFETDPNVDAAARHVPALTFDAAIARAAAGCPLVQADALSLARDADLRVVIRAASGDPRITVVHNHADQIQTVVSTEGEDADGIRYEDDPRRTAVGA